MTCLVGGDRASARLARLFPLVLALTVACASQEPSRRIGPRPVRQEVLSAFRLNEPMGTDELAADAPAGTDPRPAPEDGPPLVGRPGPELLRPAEAQALSLEDVLLAVERQFPLVLAAMEQREMAAGKVLAAQGGFDTKLGAKGKFNVDGYYENDRFDIGLEQPTTLWGTVIEGGYRRGDGSFPIYEGKDKTNIGGELRLGATVPLLQGGRIDARRVALWKARLAEDQAGPQIEAKRIEATRKAAESYWKWLAWGEKAAIARGLLGLADDRQRQVRVSVDAGQMAEIALVDNERLMVDRSTKLLAVEQGLAEAAIGLSLFWRDEEGGPLVPSAEWLPSGFPRPRPPSEVLVGNDIELALNRRPELRELDLELERSRLDLDLAENSMLPNLDVGLFGSQDRGRAVNSPDNKDEFELQAVVRFSVPLQRRKPAGTRRRLEAKLVKMEQERRYLADRVVTEVQSAVNAITATWSRLEQAARNVSLARQLEQAERTELSLGESDLLRVNLRESQTAVAASALVDIMSEHYLALAGYRAVLGLPYDEILAGEPVGGAEVQRR